MQSLISPAVLTMLLGSYLLCGCSRGDQAQQGAASPIAVARPARDAEDTPAAPATPADHPCQLLTDSEVNDVFPGAAAGKRDTSLDKYGIATCVWGTPTDRFVVQLLKVGSGSVADEVHSRASGSVDPMLQGAAADRVRYETVAGVGDEAMSIVEKADPARGILSDTAVLVTQRGERRAVLFTGSALAGGDRASALKSLETLGRSVAKRL